MSHFLHQSPCTIRYIPATNTTTHCHVLIVIAVINKTIPTISSFHILQLIFHLHFFITSQGLIKVTIYKIYIFESFVHLMKKGLLMKINTGSEVDFGTIKKVDNIWKNAFKVTYSDTLVQKKDYLDDIFFILYRGSKIVSTGRLRSVEGVKFMNQKISFMGIADIVSVEQGKGYGKILMKHIIEYLFMHEQKGIGFCRRSNSGFYKKSGLSISKDMVKQFRFINNGKMEKNVWDDDVIHYLADDLIKDVKKHPNEIVICNQKSW